MAIHIPHGYTPLKEALGVPDVPCEHCDNGTVHLDNGRSFPCVFCGGTGVDDYEEMKLARQNLGLVICKECNGSKMQDCEDCLYTDSQADCKTCDGYTRVECEHCDGFGYLFVDNRSDLEYARGVPGWARLYAEGLMEEYGQ